MGPFAFQINSLTRTFEYPWSFYATTLRPGMRSVDLGAGASGFQFVLAQSGVEVVSVDPLENPSGDVNWVFSQDEFQRLNRAFGGRVRFVKDYLERAHLAEGGYDRVFAISVLEHVPEENVSSIMREVCRILKPGGFFVGTIDLFIDCYPFTDQIANRFGRNISVRDAVRESGLMLRIGTSDQLFGYPEFEPRKVLENRENFLVDNNVMTQCIVLQKRGQ
jgi:2-polyprenyl-3-methyl-5-hydroxy-6-metoxy-1,4-benzoquinol methylase